jgi:glycosyltransferase involved in cell wall biosynthesis
VETVLHTTRPTATDTLHVAINGQLVSSSQTYRNAGVSRYTWRLIEALAARETEQRYTVFANPAGGAALAHLASGHLRIADDGWPTAHPAQRILWEQVALPAALARGGVDVFHSPVNVLPLRSLPCATVVTIHDLTFIHYPQHLRPARRFYQRTFTPRSARAATLVITVSECTKRDLVAQVGVDPTRVRVVYPSVDARFQPCADQEQLRVFRGWHGLPDRFLLYLGTLEPRKNLRALLEAYAILRGRDPSTPPLVLAGAKGWYHEDLFAQVRALDLERFVVFPGYIADEKQALWYAAADLFVYPSLYEGFGLPVAEAMACGTPVVTSDVSSLPEVGGPWAVGVNPRDTAALAHAMQSVLRGSETSRRLIAEGVRWARQFSTERMAQGCRKAYAEAASLLSGDLRGSRVADR